MRTQAILLFILGLVVYPPFAEAQQATPPERSILVHAEPNKKMLPWLLNSDLDIMCAHHEHLDLLCSPLEVARLRSLGIPVEIVRENVFGNAPNNNGFLDEYLTLAEVNEQLDDLAARFPDLTELSVLGTSIEGRDIRALKISDNAAQDEDEAEALLMGTHHAREVITPIICMHMADELLNQYGTDPTITELVNEREIWIVPVVNPDGYFYAQTEDLCWRKNRRDNPGPNDGVDLNRNWAFEWGHDDIGSSDNFSADIYRGSGPASEPEIQVMQNFVASRNFEVALSYHSFGNVLLWGTGYKPVDSPDHDIFQGIANAVSAQNEYRAGNQTTGTIYLVNGECTDYLYNVEGIIAFTSEVGTGGDSFNPPASRIPTLIEEGSVCAWEILRVADQPGQVAPPGQPLPNPIAANSGNYDVTWSKPIVADTEPVAYELVEKTGPAVITDDIENDGGNFDLGSWAVSSARSFSGSFSLFGGTSNSLHNVCLAKEGYTVRQGDVYSFRANWDIENDYDYAYAIISTDGGRSYESLQNAFTTMDDPNGQNTGNGITGHSNGWQLLEFDLGPYVGQTVWLGFRFRTDGGTTGPGMWIDDIQPVQTWATSEVLDSNIAGTSYSISGQPLGSYWYTIRGLDAEGDWGYISDYTTTTIQSLTVPVTYNLFRGILVSGTVADVQLSDGSYLSLNPGFTINSEEAPVWLTFDAVLTGDSPTSLALQVESSANTPSIEQTVELFNWTTNAYVELETIDTSFNVDTVHTIDISSSASDFVRSGTGEVSSRVGYRANGFLLLFPWTINIDHVGWLAE